jgi:hypothetical protein
VPAAAIQPDVNPSPTSHQTVTSSLRNSSLCASNIRFFYLLLICSVQFLLCSERSALGLLLVCSTLLSDLPIDRFLFFRFVMFSIGFKLQEVSYFLPTFDTISFIPESKIWKVCVLFDFLWIPFRGFAQKKILFSVLLSCNLTNSHALDSFRTQQETALCSRDYNFDCLALYQPCNQYYRSRPTLSD